MTNTNKAGAEQLSGVEMTTTAQGDALLPCPFCGGDAHDLTDGEYITCGDCGAMGAVSIPDTDRTAAYMWNQRAALASSPAPLGEAVNALLTPTKMVPCTWGGEQAEWRMEAYYYSFAPTGVAAIDRILSAVACAGKAFHHTEQWNEDAGPYGDHLRGPTPVLWIENAAEDAARLIRAAMSPPERPKGQDTPNGDHANA